MFYCGIDIAKYKHEATVIDEAGVALLDSISFANSKEGCEKLLALFQRLNISQESLLVGMEATGHYWLSVYGYLLECGFEVKVINPIQSEAFRKMYIRQTKNDRKDSFIIAQIMRFGQFSATNLSEEVIVAMRQLSRYRLALVDACGDCIPYPRGTAVCFHQKARQSFGKGQPWPVWERESGAAEGCGSQFLRGEFCQRSLCLSDPAAHRAAGVPGGTDRGTGGANFLSVEADRQLHHHHSRNWRHSGGHYPERNWRHPSLRCT